MRKRLRHISPLIILECFQFSGGLTGDRCAETQAKIGGDGLAILPGAEVQRMAHQMNDAGLEHGVREDGGMALGKSPSARPRP